MLAAKEVPKVEKEAKESVKQNYSADILWLEIRRQQSRVYRKPKNPG